MNRIFSISVILFSCACFHPIQAQDDASKNLQAITGTWTWTTRQSDGSLYSSVMDIEKGETDQLKGAIRNPQGKAIPFESVQWTDGTLTVRLQEELVGQKYSAEYKGKLSGDTIKGNVRIGFAGGKIERPWKAIRLEEYPLDGEWNWKLQTPDGNELKAVLHINHTKDGVSGRLVSDQFDSELNNVTFAKGELKFTTTSQDGNTTYSSKGKWHGNRLVGEVGSPSFGEDLKLVWEAIKR